MDKSMKSAAKHLDTSGVICRSGQMIELFACRRKSTSMYYYFDGLNTCNDSRISSDFQPTWFSRSQVINTRKTLSDNDFYQGIPMSDLEWVRFSISESPETI